MAPSPPDAQCAHHTLSIGAVTIAYRHTPGRTPGIVFLGGFMSDMTGTKATALEAWAVERGLAFTRFDYRGHGASSERFEDGTIGLWCDDALAVLDRVTTGPQILVGSSMGGWIALLVARARPERIAGLVGIAAAPDFTEDLMWSTFDEATRRTILDEGVMLSSHENGGKREPVTRALIEDGRHHLILRAPMPVSVPVRLLHGVADATVPWRTGVALLDCLDGEDVRLVLVKDGDHRLSRPADLALISATVAELAGVAP